LYKRRNSLDHFVKIVCGDTIPLFLTPSPHSVLSCRTEGIGSCSPSISISSHPVPPPLTQPVPDQPKSKNIFSCPSTNESPQSKSKENMYSWLVRNAAVLRLRHDLSIRNPCAKVLVCDCPCVVLLQAFCHALRGCSSSNLAQQTLCFIPDPLNCKSLHCYCRSSTCSS